MVKKMLIDIDSERIKVGLTEDGKLSEYYIEKRFMENIVGNVYKGRVDRVLPGMNAAYVDIGVDDKAYMSLDEEPYDFNHGYHDVSARPRRLKLAEGEVIPVQVVKERSHNKHATVSCRITVPLRLLVLVPYENYVIVSKKIIDPEKRAALAAIIEKVKPEGVGVILRTFAGEATEQELLLELNNAIMIWYDIQYTYTKAQVYDVIRYERDLTSRAFRDLFHLGVTEIVTNNKEAYDGINSTLIYMYPRFNTKLTLLAEGRDIFGDLGLTPQIDAILERKIDIGNGSYIVIDSAEALTSVDVNSGRFLGGSNAEDSAMQVNLSAAAEIARQIRLRNISGIIICDFIDQEREENRKELLAFFKRELDKDRASVNVGGISELGLVELTRKKQRNEIAFHLLQDCPYCDGSGFVFSCFQIVDKIKNAVIAFLEKHKERNLVVRVSPVLAEYIKAQKPYSRSLAEIWTDLNIYVKAESGYTVEKHSVSALSPKDDPAALTDLRSLHTAE